MGRVIAIDGPSGAGKSTVAKLLAGMLGFNYLDTGALYRAAALGLRRKGITPEDTDERLSEALGGISVVFSGGRVFLDGEDVSEEIRTPEAGHYSSVFSARMPVRDFLLPVQRDAAQNNDLVAEGRDMSTVVFPDAWKKFYMDANIEERAKRRHLQLQQGGVSVSMENAREDVIGRDKRDTSRDIAPLRVAESAVFIDSSDMPLEEVINKMLGVVRSETARRGAGG
ncbi:MAG: (d)CMP kinase [Thermodesulfovibrionales bacterium]|nr:(d)CMP kinase [Thermodesulfovibrionales bacterium]